MRKFKNILTGLVEDVTNPVLIEQYEKHTERYQEVKAVAEQKEPTKKASKK